jgi:hypothetical protein
VARPESISVGTGELRATVKDSTFLGSYVEYELVLADGQDNMLAVDGEWMSRGLHAPGDVIEWELLPERAFVLPPEATDEVSGER